MNTKTTKKLSLKFLGADGKSHTIIVPKPIENLTAETVEQSMGQLVAADVFYKEDQALLKEVQKASINESTVTVLVDKTTK